MRGSRFCTHLRFLRSQYVLRSYAMRMIPLITSSVGSWRSQSASCLCRGFDKHTCSEYISKLSRPTSAMVTYGSTKRTVSLRASLRSLVMNRLPCGTCHDFSRISRPLAVNTHLAVNSPRPRLASASGTTTRTLSVVITRNWYGVTRL